MFNFELKTNKSFTTFFVAQCISLIWVFMLPSVGRSMYFNAKHRADSITSPENPTDGGLSVDVREESKANYYVCDKDEYPKNMRSSSIILQEQSDNNKSTFSCSRAFTLLWHHFKKSYSNLIVIQWSMWWALAMCGFLQVCKYKHAGNSLVHFTTILPTMLPYKKSQSTKDFPA